MGQAALTRVRDSLLWFSSRVDHLVLIHHLHILIHHLVTVEGNREAIEWGCGLSPALPELMGETVSCLDHLSGLVGDCYLYLIAVCFSW